MEIKEAIEKLNNFKNYVNCGLLSNALLSDTQQAINTVLEELNNSIPREKIKKLAEETNHYAIGYDSTTADYKQSQGIGEYMAYIKLLNNKE